MAGLAAGMLTGLFTPAPASAASCSNTVVGGSNNSSAYITTASSTPFRHGPGGDYCAYSHESGKAFVWCTTSSRNWWYVRDDSSNVLGWVYKDNILTKSMSGSVHTCP
jgi:hypothetical protein